MKVYLSSTLDDLGDERRAARDALVASGCAVQESYTADEKSLRESCLDDVEKCDAYLLILGLRYGFVPQFDQQHQVDHPARVRAREGQGPAAPRVHQERVRSVGQPERRVHR